MARLGIPIPPRTTPWTIAALCVAILAGSASASELRPADGGASSRAGWRSCDVTRKPLIRLRKEPAYGSEAPSHIAIRLGDASKGIIPGVLDTSKGKGSRYDRLYLDANSNLDLTDDPPINIATNPAAESLAFDSDPIPVVVRYAGGARQTLRIRLEVRGTKAGKSEDAVAWTVMAAADQHMEGRVDIGPRTNLLIGIYDASRGELLPNGCFNDYETDRLRVDMNGDGILDARTEEYPLSKALSLDGKLWDFAVDAAGADLRIAPSTARTGRMRLRYAVAVAQTVAGEAELISGRGYAFTCAIAQDGEADVPAGDYAVASARMAATDATGGTWKAVFALPEPFTVGRGKTAEVTLGPPLKAVPLVHKGTPSPGNDLCIVADLTGVRGESYADISRTGARMAPLVKVIDANDIVVAQGNMEYG